MKPEFKCDMLVCLSEIKDHFSTFEEYFIHIIKTAMAETNNTIDENEIKEIIDNGLFLKFETKNIPFTFKFI
ncbi:MAG: hypothetical protein MUF58_14335 [Arcicella sp.]|jgi:hypothetical protein|nr:hypothetical protein [Arcicella sp.]